MLGAPRFREALEALHRHRVEFVVVGGVAAILQGAPISTLDTDIVYRRTPENIDLLMAALRDLEALYRDSAGRRIEPAAARFAQGGQHLLATRLGPLDVLATAGAGSTYEDLAPRADRFELEGMSVLVLGLPALIETKEQAGRDKDRLALPLLREALRLRGIDPV